MVAAPAVPVFTWSGGVRRARPSTAHRDVEEEAKAVGIVEYPSPIGGNVVSGPNEVGRAPIVHIHLDHERRPDLSVDMTARIVYPASIRQCDIRAKAEKAPAGPEGAMNRGLDDGRSKPSRLSRFGHVLHDVHLAGEARPDGPKQPEGRPEAGAGRQPHTRFQPPVLKILDSQRLETRGGPGPRRSGDGPGSEGLDREVSLAVLEDIRLVGLAGGLHFRSAVSLQLPVAPFAGGGNTKHQLSTAR